jgi:hypothetical protein
MKTIVIGFIAAALTMLTVSVAGQVQKQTAAAAQTPALNVGRYQVVPTNADFFKVVLVDTTTGDTWTVCLIDSPTDPAVSVKQWCALARSNAHGVISKPK